MPTWYKITAFWGGLDGSLLFWVLVLALFSTVAIVVEPQAAPRHDRLRRRDDHGRAGVLPVAPDLHEEPVRDVPHHAAGRRQGPEPAAPELLDGDPSAVALHRLRRRDDSVRVRHRRARVGPPRRHVARLGARVDADLLRLPLARPHPRRPLGVRGARLGRLLGVGSGRERRASCRGSRRPRSCTPRSSRSSAG